MMSGALEFQTNQYRIRNELYQTSSFTVYELMDPIELGSTSTLFVAVTRDGQLYSVNVFESQDDAILSTCYGLVSICKEPVE